MMTSLPSLSLCISLSHRAHLTHNIGSAPALPLIPIKSWLRLCDFFCKVLGIASIGFLPCETPAASSFFARTFSQGIFVNRVIFEKESLQGENNKREERDRAARIQGRPQRARDRAARIRCRTQRARDRAARTRCRPQRPRDRAARIRCRPQRASSSRKERSRED